MEGMQRFNGFYVSATGAHRRFGMSDVVLDALVGDVEISGGRIYAIAILRHRAGYQFRVRVGDCIEHFVELPAPGSLFPDATHLALDFSLNLAATQLKHLLQFAIAGLRHPLFRPRPLSVLHHAAPSSPPIKMAVGCANDMPVLSSVKVIRPNRRFARAFPAEL